MDKKSKQVRQMGATGAVLEKESLKVHGDKLGDVATPRRGQEKSNSRTSAKSRSPRR